MEGCVEGNQVSFYCTKAGMSRSDAGIHMTFTLSWTPWLHIHKSLALKYTRFEPWNQMKASREEHDAGSWTVSWINFLFFIRLSFLSISPNVMPDGLICLSSLLHMTSIAPCVFTCVCYLLSQTFYTWECRDKESLGDDMQSHVGTTTDRKIHTRILKHQRPEQTGRGFHSFWLLLNVCHVLWFISFRLPLLFQGYKFI